MMSRNNRGKMRESGCPLERLAADIFGKVNYAVIEIHLDNWELLNIYIAYPQDKVV